MTDCQLFCQLTAKRHRLCVKQRGTLRWISWDDDFVQTIINVYQPWQPQLRYLPALCYPITLTGARRLALLGTGGGGLLHYLKHHHPSIQLVAIDRCQQMITLAHRYFGISLPIHCIDAGSFVTAQTDNANDILVLDIHTNNQPPPLLSDDDFWYDCQRSTRYCICINLVTQSPSQRREAVENISQRFNQQVMIMPIEQSNNIVIHGFLDKAK